MVDSIVNTYACIKHINRWSTPINRANSIENTAVPVCTACPNAAKMNINDINTNVIVNAVKDYKIGNDGYVVVFDSNDNIVWIKDVPIAYTNELITALIYLLSSKKIRT